MEGSNGKVVDLLERIANGVAGINERLDVTNERLDATNERLDLTILEMRRGFAGVHARIDATNARIDNALTFLGGHYRDHEERIRTLEAIVLSKPG